MTHNLLRNVCSFANPTQYLDNVFAPALLANTGVKLVRVPLKQTSDAVENVTANGAAGTSAF